MSLSDAITIRNDVGFGGRVHAAVMERSFAIINEAPANTDPDYENYYERRRTLGSTYIQNNTYPIDPFVWGCALSADVQADGVNCTDATISALVLDLWDSAAGISESDAPPAS